MYNSRSYRTKRRRIQNELLALESSCSDVEDNNVDDDDLVLNYNNITNDRNLHENNSKNVSIEDLSVGFDNIGHIQHVLTNNDGASIISGLDKIHEDNVYFDHKKNVKQAIGKWAVDFNIPQNAVNALLNVLKNKAGLDFLPNDCRTLLHNKSTKILNLRTISATAEYYHFGLGNGIKRCASIFSLHDEIKIAIGIDGLPLSKCSSSQFWPILAYIQPHHKYVFPVGVYHGYEKPKDSNEFLQDLISEILELTENGITIDNIKKKIKIQVICCDAPAKSFILRIKGHSGFSSCTRCVHEGEYSNNRVCFPYIDNGSASRTHDDYVCMKDEEHHISSTISCISLIPDIDIISLFSMDYMHLVCLGAMRKLINLWIKGPLNVRLPSWKIKLISTSLCSLNINITNDFSRKPRSLDEINRWKATELRQFLLYTGIVVLKNVLTKECYQHFLALNIAIRILLGSDLSQYLNFAKQLLEYFVKTFQFIYVKQFISHNIHGLQHLTDDYIQYGPLDCCSAFPFENYMKSLKSMLRKREKPLQQVIKRYEEQCRIGNWKSENEQKINFNSNIPNCYVITHCGEIVRIVEMLNSSIIVHKFNVKEDLYDIPIKSSNLDIYIVKNLSNDLVQFSITDIIQKLLIFDFENKQIVVPILHHN